MSVGVFAHVRAGERVVDHYMRRADDRIQKAFGYAILATFALLVMAAIITGDAVLK